MIFRPFTRVTRRKGAVKGSGLGLSIARDCRPADTRGGGLVDAPAGLGLFSHLRFPQAPE